MPFGRRFLVENLTFCITGGHGGGQRGDPPLETPHPLKNAFNYHLKTPSSYNPPSKSYEILNTPSPWNLGLCPPVAFFQGGDHNASEGYFIKRN